MNLEYENLLTECDLLKARVNHLSESNKRVVEETEMYRKALSGANERIKLLINTLASASAVIVEMSDLLKSNGIESSTLEYAKARLEGMIKSEIQTNR